MATIGLALRVSETRLSSSDPIHLANDNHDLIGLLQEQLKTHVKAAIQSVSFDSDISTVYPPSGRLGFCPEHRTIWIIPTPCWFEPRTNSEPFVIASFYVLPSGTLPSGKNKDVSVGDQLSHCEFRHHPIFVFKTHNSIHIPQGPSQRLILTKNGKI